MLPLVVWLLAAFGAAYIVGHSVISLPVRLYLAGTDETPGVAPWLVALLECPACFGTWLGAFAGVLAPQWFGVDSQWLGLALGACATCGSNYLLARATGILPPP